MLPLRLFVWCNAMTCMVWFGLLSAGTGIRRALEVTAQKEKSETFVILRTHQPYKTVATGSSWGGTKWSMCESKTSILHPWRGIQRKNSQRTISTRTCNRRMIVGLDPWPFIICARAEWPHTLVRSKLAYITTLLVLRIVSKFRWVQQILSFSTGSDAPILMPTYTEIIVCKWSWVILWFILSWCAFTAQPYSSEVQRKKLWHLCMLGPRTEWK